MLSSRIASGLPKSLHGALRVAAAMLCLCAPALGASRHGQSSNVESLLKHLQNKKCEVRDRAASGLGDSGDARAVAPLAAALSDPCTSVRITAALALSKIKDPSVVEPLIAIVQNRP